MLLYGVVFGVWLGGYCLFGLLGFCWVYLVACLLFVLGFCIVLLFVLFTSDLGVVIVLLICVYYGFVYHWGYLVTCVCVD